MKKEKLISYLVLMGIIFALPSVIYLVQNDGNLAGYSGQYFYHIGNTHPVFTILGALVYAWCLILMLILYWKLIQVSDQFSNVKSILITSLIVGITFAMILPNTSKDVFFYMGSGRAFEKYKVNPYTTSIGEIDNVDVTDDIIETVGTQKSYTFVYGPVFLAICGLLSKISLSSVCLLLYEFKLLNLLAYLGTVYLVYQLTQKKKLTVAYAWNPLVLLEVLVNVHNEIFVLLFAFLGIFLIKEAEKCRKQFGKSEFAFLCGLICLAISACIKYVAIILLPFVILYRLRKNKIWQKILIGIVYIVIFFGIFSVTYLPYFENPMQSFGGVLAQSSKLKDSIYLIIAMLTTQNQKIVSLCYSVGFFVLGYVFIIKVLMQAFRKNSFQAMMQNIYMVLFALIFLGLTNLTSWYLLWLCIPVFWTKGRRLKEWIWIRILL